MQKEIIRQDSMTLDNFIHSMKKQSLNQKKSRKQVETRIRKDSTQLSIFGWLVKDRPKQNCLIVSVDKALIIQIFKFMRISQIASLSRTCSYLYDCAKSIWNDRNFFSQLETDKFTNKQLTKVIQKSTKLSHIRQLKNIYSGKNIGSCRQRIKLRISQNMQIPGILLENFEVQPKNNRNSFLNDLHLEEIVNSSYRSLKTIKLSYCTFIKKFQILSRCYSLLNLTITYNSQFNSDDLIKICKRCSNIQTMNLIQCRNLDQNIFKHISLLNKLQKLSLRSYRQNFKNIHFLQHNTLLKHVDLQNSLILNEQIQTMIKSCPSITNININGCQFLENPFLQFLIKFECNLKQIQLQRTSISQDMILKFKKIKKNIGIIEPIERLSE